MTECLWLIGPPAPAALDAYYQRERRFWRHLERVPLMTLPSPKSAGFDLANLAVQSPGPGVRRLLFLTPASTRAQPPGPAAFCIRPATLRARARNGADGPAHGRQPSWVARRSRPGASCCSFYTWPACPRAVVRPPPLQVGHGRRGRGRIHFGALFLDKQTGEGSRQPGGDLIWRPYMLRTGFIPRLFMTQSKSSPTPAVGWCWPLFLITWMGDTCAYFVGSSALPAQAGLPVSPGSAAGCLSVTFWW